MEIHLICWLARRKKLTRTGENNRRKNSFVLIFFLNVVILPAIWYKNLNSSTKEVIMDFESIATQAAAQFADCHKLLIALGDETRQAIITTLIGCNCNGMRVGEITSKTHLSRPAVSHHLKLLLNEEVIGITHESTKNYYWLKLGGKWPKLVSLVENIEKMRSMAK
jgi:ArsR family transcriptional regulator